VPALCVAGSMPEWRRAEYPLGLTIDFADTPVAACDFIAAHDLRGRGFNPFHFGGYQLWRFWPDPGRLPFMDIHQTGTPLGRALAAAAFSSRPAYRRLTAQFGFDYALLDRRTAAEYRLLDFFDQDTTWRLIFLDDVAALFVPRAGPYAALADSAGYVAWPAGFGDLDGLARRYAADPAYRAQVDRELARQVAASPRNAMAHNFRANLALFQFHDAEARRELEAALAVDPELPGAWDRLGLIALRAGNPREAIADFERQRAREGPAPGLELRMGQAWSRLGDRARARAHYRRELARDPDNTEAADSLRALGP
jgi:tetratricopeptide (TPR) repeat protein